MHVPPVAKPKTSPTAYPRSVRGEAPGRVHPALWSGGRPLDAPTRAYFEPRFGHDFSRVRIHSDAEAAASAGTHNALAYTVGPHVVFATGAFDTQSAAGRRLLAHELTHVVQQSAGGAPPGAAQERDAEAASRAVGAGRLPHVREPSDVGFAAQRLLSASDDVVSEARAAGVQVVTYSKIEANVNKALKSPGAAVLQGRADFNKSPARAKANLYHTHFRDDQERLSYAIGAFQETLGAGGDAVDPEELYAMLLQYETQVQGQGADLIIHSQPTAAEAQQLRTLTDRRNYDFYRAEVARLEKAARERTVAGTGRYSGAATLGLYESQIGVPVQAGIEALREEIIEKSPVIASQLANFIPVIGQLKVIAEGVIGRDLITGAELKNWERGLNVLLGLLPEAKGIFSAGRAGISRLAAAAADSGLAADEVYATAKGASELSAAEVEAAEQFAAGAPKNPVQLRKVARVLEEMEPGATEAAPHPSEPVKPSAPKKAPPPEPKTKGAKPEPGGAEAGAARFGPPRKVFLRGEYHELKIGRIGKRWSFLLCSGVCGPIIEKANAMLARLSASHPAYGGLKNLVHEAEIADTWVNDVWHEVEEGKELNDAQLKLQELESDLAKIEAQYPDAVLPDISTQPAAAPTPEAHPPAGAPPAVPEVLPPPGQAAGSLRVGKLQLSLRGLNAEQPLAGQLLEGEMAALKRSPNLQGVGAEELPYLSPRDLAQMVAEGRITKSVFDGIMKAAEERIAARVGGGG